MLNDLVIGSVYNFITLAPAVLGAEYNNAKVLGFLDFESANAIVDCVPLHAACYPRLPNSTPVNAQDLTYIKIKTSSGEKRVLATVWISGTPTLVTNKTVSVTISNMDTSKLDLLRTSLTHNGFDNFKIEVLS